MPDVSTPEKLQAFASHHWENGGIGLLISGGSTSKGNVPLDAFYPKIRWVKENTGLILNIHTGLLDKKEAKEIANSGVDIASVDIVGSDETIKNVYGLDSDSHDYEETLWTLRDTGINIVPHICVGLDFGKIKGEIRALEIVSALKPEVIGIIALIPTAGTAMASITPPSVEDIVQVITEAKKLNPGSEISLGCMHSKIEKLRLEEAAINAGATRMVLPSRITIKKTVEAGFEVRSFDACCSLPKNLESKALRKT